MASLTEGSQLALWAFVGCVLAVCFVSGITGDVPDDVVYTDLHKTVQLGDRAVLKCLFYGTPLAVFWKKGNDPRTAPNLITRIEGEHDLGSCVQDKTCEMNGDYSLTIKNVTIADQGRYICRVSNYMGILIHGYTDFKVYATPEEPYPFINECTENGKNCTVSAQDPLNITCTASRYFPIIDLLFLNGGQKVSTIETVEWENDDGTKSKLIFTRVPPSKIPYVCMAFNIPGSQDERTSTISVFDHHANTTFGEPTETDLSRIFKIGLSVGLSTVAGVVVCILVVGLVKILCKKCQGRERKISYYELWFLAGKMTESQANQSKLRDTFKYLKFTAVIREGKLTQLEAYQALCQWKEENREVDQPKDLKEASVKFRFGDVWTKMMDEKGEVKRKVSQETMKHILWTIGDIEKVNRFLRQLIPDQDPINGNDKMVCVVDEALDALNAWSKASLGLNPFVLMSLALENAGCTPFEKMHFSVPDELMAPIQDEKLKEFTDKLTGRHCKRLDMALKLNNQKIDDYISKNRYNVFDTRSLVTEWLGTVECSNYEKRCRLDKAVIKSGRGDLQDFFTTLEDHPKAEESFYFDHESIYDDDITQLVKLVKWLPPDKKAQLKQKIGLPDEKEDDDKTLKDQMKTWRDSVTTTSSDVSKEFQSFRKELINNTTYTELTLTDEEIEAVPSLVNSTDKQQELTSILKIDAVRGRKKFFVGQLKQWRNIQAEKCCRETLQKALEQTGIAELTLTDEEIEAVPSLVTSTDKQQELTSILKIDAVSGRKDFFVDQLKQWRNIQAETFCRETLQKALEQIGLAELTLTDEEIEAVPSLVTSTDKQQELTSILKIDAVHGQNDFFVGQLKQWINIQAKKNCREALQKALEQIGLAECIVSKSTTNQLDQQELPRIAHDLMMEDVRPIIVALGIDQKKVDACVRRWNNQSNCTTALLVNLKGESRNREGFCKALRNVGFIDIARSVFFGEKVSVTPKKP